MKQSALRKAEVNALVDAYRVAASAHGHATETGDYKRTHREYDEITAIYLELRSRGADAVRALLPLLDDPDAGVRGWAGSHALEFFPAEGERTLVAMCGIPNSLVSFSAYMTLREWRAGRLKFP